MFQSGLVVYGCRCVRVYSVSVSLCGSLHLSSTDCAPLWPHSLNFCLPCGTSAFSRRLLGLVFGLWQAGLLVGIGCSGAGRNSYRGYIARCRGIRVNRIIGAHTHTYALRATDTPHTYIYMYTHICGSTEVGVMTNWRVFQKAGMEDDTSRSVAQFLMVYCAFCSSASVENDVHSFVKCAAFL